MATQPTSPRTAAPRLRSTSVEHGEGPRRTVSVYQAVALSRGYTVKAGAATRARLYRGIPKPGSDLTYHVQTDTLVSDSNNAEHDHSQH